MKALLVPALLAAILAPQEQEDWREEMKKMGEDVTKISGPTYLLRSLRQEMLRSTKALDESKLDLADRHFLRLAQVSRTYNPNHANQVVSIALALRGEIRFEGAALAAAVAEDLKQGRAKEAQARIDNAVATAHLATTYMAEVERLREWVKKPPEPAAVEAEIARWRAMMPPGSLSSCVPCKGTGEADCEACLSGTVAQTCRNCTGKGQASCAHCSGKGKIVHAGYGGDLRFLIEKSFKAYVVVNGKRRLADIHPQRMFWTLKPCKGTGKCEIRSSSTPLDPNKAAGQGGKFELTCAELFDQIKVNVFNGKAKMYTSDKDKDLLTPEQAKRFFAEYEKCSGGHLTCDACEGKQSGKCGPCGGVGMRLGACSTCNGAGSTPCPTCLTSGDSSWLAAKIPATRVPALGSCLDTHVKALQDWHEKRAKERARREQVRVRLAEARKGLDPTAKLTAEYVNVTCVKCSGKGGSCEECWGAGRREYYPGTPTHDKYAAAKKLEEQFVQLAKASYGVSTAEIQLRIEDSSIDEFKIPPAAPVEPPKPPKPAGVGSGIGGKIADLMPELQERIAKADAMHEQGKQAYERAAAAGEDNEKRKDEAVKAKNLFRDAQSLYAFVQEFLDEAGTDTPRELVDKVSTNLQALKMARNMAF